MKHNRHGADGGEGSGGPKTEGTTKGDEASQDDPESEDSLKSDTLEDYERVFVFLHHYAGPDDPLSAAMRRGIKIKVTSVEKEAGAGDLLDAEPYTTHLRWASRGYIDAYHAGFPCSTCSRLRHRPVEGLPGPVRSKDEPYGLRSNSTRQQESCDVGTILPPDRLTSQQRWQI